MTIIACYADGGVIGRNPSPVGGTFAWCHVDMDNIQVASYSGVITPVEAGLPAITNNLTEMLALVAGLEALPAGWAGTIYSDSQVTLGRMFEGWKMNNIPAWLVRRGSAALQHINRPRCSCVLLDGHPTQVQLAAGRGKRGAPVSEWNVWCDKACGKAGLVLL